MGMFDDLVPTAAAPARSAPPPSVAPSKGSGMFDDLVPQAPAIDTTQPVDAIRAQLAQMPPKQREQAMAAWADAQVAKDREGGGIMQTADDHMRRFSKSVPGIGSWLDEANAVTSAALGRSKYDEALAYEQAKDRAIENTETTKLGTLPLVGDVTTGGLSKAAGTVAGSVAIPLARVMPGAGAIPTAVNVGGNAAVQGAVQAAGEAKEGERGEAALLGGATSAAIAAPLGAVVGKLVSRGAPAANAELAAAAEKAQVALPRVAATGDDAAGWAQRHAAGSLSGVPVVGAPLRQASARAVGDMENAATRIAGEYSPGVTAQSAGETAKTALTEWIKTGSSKTVGTMYDDVAKIIPTAAYRPITNTRDAVTKLAAEDIAAASAVNKPAMDLVEAAINTPGGLNFAGTLRLRTNIGAMIDDGLLPAAGTTKPALKRIYEGLTKDLEASAWQFGGADGVKAWNKATTISRMVSDRRDALTKIIGNDGAKSGENIVDTVVRMASTNSTADVGRLTLARKAMGSDAWNDVAAESIFRLGRNQSDSFSPAVFLKKYSALSEKGRDLLFSSTGKDNLKSELDALATVTERFKSLERLGNPSGTGGVVSVLGAGSAIASGFPHLLAAALPGYMAAKWMAEPVKVKQITRLANAVYELGTGQASGPALQQAVAQIARSIAVDTGEDHKTVAHRIMTALEGM